MTENIFKTIELFFHKNGMMSFVSVNGIAMPALTDGSFCAMPMRRDF